MEPSLDRGDGSRLDGSQPAGESEAEALPQPTYEQLRTASEPGLDRVDGSRLPASERLPGTVSRNPETLEQPEPPEAETLPVAQPPPHPGKPMVKKPRWTCPNCGKSLSATTKKCKHKCYFIAKEESLQPTLGGASPAALTSDQQGAGLPPRPVKAQPPPPAALQPQPITLQDITNFLLTDRRERARQRAERLEQMMF